MVELLIAVSWFIIGFLAGVTAVMLHGLHTVKKMEKAKSVLMEEVKNKALELERVKDSIKERLVAASNIAQAQMDLRAKVEAPSMNALHSRYKGELIGEIQTMELEKLRLLQSIIADGYDPQIIVLDERGAETKIPLSEYIVKAKDTLKQQGVEEQPMPVTDKKPKQMGKFLIYKGGKDDGTTH